MANDADLSGPYARDAHRGGFGDDYARDTGYSGRGPRNYRRSDERIGEDVCEALTDDPAVDARDIEIKVEQQVVTLTGRVRSRDQKRRAEDVALRCSGVHDVMNALRISAADDEVEIGKASE